MIPKPESRRRVKARAERAESQVAKRVRAAVALRDGRCRLAGAGEKVFGDCEGPGEWAHLGDARRFKTRNMAPEARHSEAWSLMLCAGHHRTGKFAYDGNRMDITPQTDKGCVGKLTYAARTGSARYAE